MRRALLILTFAASSLVPSLGWCADPPFVHARPEDLFRRSPSCVAPAFSSAQSVEVFRVAPRYEKRGATGRTFRDQTIIAGPRLLGAASARAVGKELERDYCVDWPNLYCAFVARYGVRVHSSREQIEVLVCPHCGELKFYRKERWFRSAFLAGRLLPLLQKAFPDYPLRANET